MTKLQPDFEDLQRRVRRLSRRGMARRTVIGLVVTGILAVGIVAPLTVLIKSISGDGDRSQIGATGGMPSDSPGPELTTFSDKEDGLSIQAPNDWHFDTNPVPNLVYPEIDIALGNWVFPRAEFGPTELACPNEALRELRADGVFIWIEEYEASDLGPKTAEMFATPLEDATFDDGAVIGGCANVPYYVLRFRDGERAFVVSAAFGSSTGADEQETALRIVHSMTVGRAMPDVLVVRCEGLSPVVESTEVRLQPDGLHVEWKESGDADVLTVGEAFPAEFLVPFRPPFGEETMTAVFPVAPGSVWIGCRVPDANGEILGGPEEVPDAYLRVTVLPSDG